MNSWFRGRPWGLETRPCYRAQDPLMISPNVSPLNVGGRLRVKWVDLEFTFTTVFSWILLPSIFLHFSQKKHFSVLSSQPHPRSEMVAHSQQVQTRVGVGGASLLYLPGDLLLLLFPQGFKLLPSSVPFPLPHSHFPVSFCVSSSQVFREYLYCPLSRKRNKKQFVPLRSSPWERQM